MKPAVPHPREEEAAAYVFGDLEAAERVAFVQAMSQDPVLRELVDELSSTAAMLSLSVAQQGPPPAVRERVLERLPGLSQGGAPRHVPASKPARRGLSLSWMNWAALVLLVPPLLALWGRARQSSLELQASRAELKEYQQLAERSREVSREALQQIQTLVAKLSESDKNASELQNQLAKGGEVNTMLKEQLNKAEADSEKLQQELAQRTQANEALKVELARLVQVNDLAKVEIATLQSTVKEYRQGVAVVVWNSEKKEGILKLEKMPPLDANKDYQLWVVDPSKKNPVDAGIVTIDPQGFAKVSFKPQMEVEKAEKFALSVEKKGGVPVAEGPIVLLSP